MVAPMKKRESMQNKHSKVEYKVSLKNKEAPKSTPIQTITGNNETMIVENITGKKTAILDWS